MLNPLPTYNSVAKENKKTFDEFGMEELLNRSLIGFDWAAEEKGYSNWILRFRSDNSFFMEGTSETGHEFLGKSESFYILGNYEVLASTSSQLNLTVFGELRVYTEE